MIDLTTETPMSLVQVARQQPPGRGGRPVTLGCVLRWILDGARGPSGERVRLEAIRIGGRWVTSREALQRFADRLTPHLEGDAAPKLRTAAKRQRASDQAAAELAKAGI
jgi:hypothetical protein